LKAETIKYTRARIANPRQWGALRGFEGNAAVLVELGFMDIDADYTKITTRQMDIAKAIARGIINHINRE